MKKCSMKVIKYTIFIVNLLFVLGGLALIIAGILIQTKGVTKFSEDMKMAKAFVILILCVGALVFVLAFFGVCGAIRETPWKLNVYGGLIIAMLICQIALVVVAILYRQDAMHFLKKNMRKSLKNESDATKRMWDKIQRNWECCAVNGPGDYEMPASELPESCCKPGVDNCEEGKAYTTGCYKSLKEFVMQNYYAIIGVGVIIAIIEITAAVMAFVMVRAIKNENKAPI